MPFSTTKSCNEQKWTEIFEYIIKPTIEESGLGYVCERSVAGRQNTIKGILESLNQANIVIADLTDNNPNVFYELGIRHTLANRTILIAQREEHVPFDLRPYPVAFYSESPAKIAEFKKDIKKKLADIETNPERADNPVADFLQLKNIDIQAYEKSANLRKLDALLSELSYNIDTIDRIAKDLTTIFTTHYMMQNTCMKLFLSTRYITPTLKILDDIFLCDYMVDQVNRLLSFMEKGTFSKKLTEKTAKNLIVPMKGNFTSLFRSVAKIRTDFANDNYQESKEPLIRLSSLKHKKYLKLIK